MSIKYLIKVCPWKITTHAIARNEILCVHAYKDNQNHLAHDECSSQLGLCSNRDIVVVEEVFRTTLNYLP